MSVNMRNHATEAYLFIKSISLGRVWIICVFYTGLS
jgi:hypothetical protein